MDYLTLLLTAGKPLAGVIPDLTFLYDLADVAKAQAKQLPQGPVTAGSLVAFIEQLDAQLGGVADPAQKDALTAEYARLKVALDKVAGVLGKVPPEYWRLLAPLNSFQPTDSSTVTLPLFSGGGAAPAAARYTLNASVQASLAAQAADQWPFTGDAVSDRLMRIGARGAVTAGAGLTAPYQFGSFGVSVQDAENLSLDYFFNVADLGQPFALAIADNLGHLPDPFDFNAVWAALTQSDLEGIVYDFAGSANFKVTVSFLDSFDLLDLARKVQGAITADLGVTINAAVAVSGDYSLSFRAPPTAPGASKSVIATLGRSRGAEKDLDGSLGVKLDLSKLGAYVQQLLQQTVGRWQATLDSLKPYLTPGTELQTVASQKIEAALQQLVKNDSLRAALLQDARTLLGIAPTEGGDALVGWAQDQVKAAIDRTAGLLTGDATRAADAAIAEISRALPQSFGQSAAQALIQPQVQALITEAQTALEAEVARLFEGDAEKLGAALHAAGAISAKVVATLDDASAGVRALFDKFDAALTSVMNAAEEAAKAKVVATLTLAEKSANSVDYRVRGSFTDSGDGARQVFNSLVHGDFAALGALFAPDAKTPGFVLDRANSSITTTATSSDGLGLTIAFLNFGVSDTVTLDTQVRGVVDGAGHVRIDAQANLDSKFKGLNASQDVTFFDSDALVVAGAFGAAADQPNLDMGFGISTEDNALSRSTVSQFVASLTTANLLPADATSRADNQMKEWLGAGGQNTLAGEFSATLNLSAGQLRTLLKLDTSPSGPLNHADGLDIVTRTVAALRRGRVIDPGLLLEGAQNVAGYLASQYDVSLPADRLETAILALPAYPHWPPNDGSWSMQDVNKGTDFIGEAMRVRGVATLIQRARDLYLATPRGPNDPNTHHWTAASYQQAEQDMGGALKAWLTVNDVFLLWLLPAAHPRTVAFLRAISDLAGQLGQPTMHLTLTNRPTDGAVETVVIA